jgi:hypothetical protein
MVGPSAPSPDSLTARAVGISVRTLQYRLGGSGPRPPGPSRATARRRQDGSAIAP